ncbi:helix-turn-helix domain-containing protein [Teredinibacter haidensis]|uniref:helix-turn-helix domain-containing protein n=1 Tax=Teredinibacter haidensis TaxID=2731755 RepID=UPI0009489C2B|nr:helix-turn-helix domain-containing protein [Teredinibacter haidensis]
MDSVLFNIHDVVLLTTVYQCAALAVVLFIAAPQQRLSNVFLIGFLVANAVVPLDTLINFGAAFRGWAIVNLPDWFYVFEMGYWLQGPILLWYLRSRFYKNYCLRFVDLFYLAPFFLFVLHQLLSYHVLPTSVKVEIQQSYSLFSEKSIIFFFVTLARELLRLYFGVLCVLELRHYVSTLDTGFQSSHKEMLRWLKLGVYSFVGLWGWACVLAVGIIVNVQFSEVVPIGSMGLAANYATCLLLSGYVILLGRAGATKIEWPQISYRSSLSLRLAGVAEEGSNVEPKESLPGVNLEYVHRLDALVKEGEIYLEPSLTLEMLASKLSISPRTLSTILNRHYGSNFFEFVNTYRIEEAKKLLLSDEFRNATMLDIMYKVGFKSKATFNNFFKKMEGMTPREFKKANRVVEA